MFNHLRTFPQIAPVAPPQVASWFLVELNDLTAPAFSTFPIAFGLRMDCVVVRHGQYLHFGRIIDEVRNPPDLTPASPQVLLCDKDYQLSEYLGVQAELAGNLVRSFIARTRCPATFIGVEPVSYRGRALFRLQLSDPDAPNVEDVVRLMIQAFGVAVEVID
jgi:hypothetical protein